MRSVKIYFNLKWIVEIPVFLAIAKVPADIFYQSRNIGIETNHQDLCLRAILQDSRGRDRSNNLEKDLLLNSADNITFPHCHL